jgi:hypothetical protein
MNTAVPWGYFTRNRSAQSERPKRGEEGERLLALQVAANVIEEPTLRRATMTARSDDPARGAR